MNEILEQEVEQMTFVINANASPSKEHAQCYNRPEGLQEVAVFFVMLTAAEMLSVIYVEEACSEPMKQTMHMMCSILCCYFLMERMDGTCHYTTKAKE